MIQLNFLQTRYFRILLITLLLSGAVFRVDAQGPGSQVPKSTPLINGGTCYFLQFTPWDSTVHSARHPLIIFLHGAGERGDGGFSTVNNVAANSIPLFCANKGTMGFTVNGVYNTFYVLSPQLSAFSGNWTSNYVQTMINYAKSNLNIDTNRIYLTGLSLGGGGCWRFVLDSTTTQTNQIAAMSAMSSTDEGNDTHICSVLFNSHLPMWNFADDADPNPQTGGNAMEHQRLTMVFGCNNYTPAPKWTYYSDNTHNHGWEWGSDTGHHTYTLSSTFTSSVGSGSYLQNPNLFEWLLTNTRASNTPQPPVAHTNAAQVLYTPTNQTTLTGSGTPVSPATISSYSWTKVSGPDTPVITSPSSATTTVTGLSVPGFYLFRLTVTDNNGLTGSALDSVLLNDGHPVVNAGSNQTITLPTSSVNLSGTATARPGHSIQSTTWTKSSGPSGGSITSPASLNTSVTGLTQGTYIFQLSATDDQALTSNSQVTVTVNPAAGSSLLGYIVQVPGPVGYCGNTDTTGRIAIYGDSLANNGLVYSDPAKTTLFDGGFNWYEFAATVNGPVLHDLVIYGGGIHSLSSCPGVTSSPSNGVPVLGYIKIAPGPDGYCGDTSSVGRTAIYGDSIANSVILSPDPQRKSPLDGGYNWISFSASLNGAITQTFAAYPDGSIHSLQTCPGGAQSRPGVVSGAVNSFNAASGISGGNRLTVYPNPVKDRLTLHIAGAATGKVMTRISNSTGGVVISQTDYKNGNSADLQVTLSGLPAGLYIIEIRIGTTVEFRQKIMKQ